MKSPVSSSSKHNNKHGGSSTIASSTTSTSVVNKGGKGKDTVTVEMKKKNKLSEESCAITKEVEVAAAEYNKMDHDLSMLINAFQQQYNVTKQCNERKLETMILLEKFAQDTPFAKIVGSIDSKKITGVTSPTTKAVEGRDDVTPPAPISLTKSSGSSVVKTVSFLEKIETTAIEDGDDEPRVDAAADGVKLSKSNSSINSQSVMKYSPSPSKEEKLSPKKGIKKESEKKSKKLDSPKHAATTSKTMKHGKMVASGSSSSPSTSPPPPEIPSSPSTLVLQTTSKVPLGGASTSYCDIRRNMYVDSSNNLEQSIDIVLTYIQKWKKINQTRIKAGIFEFNEMTTKLEHYAKKMDAMNKEGSGKKGSEADSTASPKMERNQQKLLGALEAHTTYGEKLLKYIDETTQRGWKDLFPLVVKMLHMDISDLTAQMTYKSHLESVLEKLKTMGQDDYQLQCEGRLHLLESEPLGDVYTGEQRRKVKSSYATTK